MSEDLKAAVAAGVVGSQELFRELLQSVVEVARAIFGAEASSIFLLDEETDELVFEAVASGSPRARGSQAGCSSRASRS
jgi:GAF domain-containing protein